MIFITKPVLAAALLTAASVGAIADTGRPSDYVDPVRTPTVDRHADDAFARYQAVVDGASRSVFEKHAETDVLPAGDAYAKYLMVIDGMGRDAAVERARLRQESVAQADKSLSARAAR